MVLNNWKHFQISTGTPPRDHENPPQYIPPVLSPWNRGLSTIAIFTYKQRLLNKDMKTKVVQHGPRLIFNVF